MSGERGRSTIETATWESIQHNTYDGNGYPCGCYPSRKEPHLRFHLCDYHEGYDEGYANLAAERDEVARLRAEIERLRAAGDALAGYVDDSYYGTDFERSFIAAWQDARYGR